MAIRSMTTSSNSGAAWGLPLSQSSLLRPEEYPFVADLLCQDCRDWIGLASNRYGRMMCSGVSGPYRYSHVSKLIGASRIGNPLKGSMSDPTLRLEPRAPGGLAPVEGRQG